MYGIERKDVFRFLLLVGFIALIIWVHVAGLARYITLENLKMQSDYLLYLVKNYRALSILFFLIIYTLAVALSLPAAFLITVAGGFLFGTVMGTVYSVVASTCGALLSFLLVRYALGSFIQKRYVNQLHTFNKLVDNYGILFLIFIHFVAIVPFVIINTLAGLTQISAWTFTWTTALGIIPTFLVYAYAGSQLHEIHTLGDIFSKPVIGALFLLGLFAIVPLVVTLLTSNFKKLLK